MLMKYINTVFHYILNVNPSYFRGWSERVSLWVQRRGFFQLIISIWIAPAGFYALCRSKEKHGIGQQQIDRGKLFWYPWFVFEVTWLHQSFKENLPFQEFSIWYLWSWSFLYHLHLHACQVDVIMDIHSDSPIHGNFEVIKCIYFGGLKEERE